MATPRSGGDVTRIGCLADVPPGTMIAAALEGRPIVVANLGDEVVAFQNSCLHAGVRLSEGLLNGAVVTCRWHQWRYCLRSGEVLTDESPYATFTTFPVDVRDGEMYVHHSPRTTITARPDTAEPQ